MIPEQLKSSVPILLILLSAILEPERVYSKLPRNNWCAQFELFWICYTTAKHISHYKASIKSILLTINKKRLFWAFNYEKFKS